MPRSLRTYSEREHRGASRLVRTCPRKYGHWTTYRRPKQTIISAGSRPSLFGQPECHSLDSFSRSMPTRMFRQNSTRPLRAHHPPLLPFNTMLRRATEYLSARWPPSREDNVHPALFHSLRLGVDRSLCVHQQTSRADVVATIWVLVSNTFCRCYLHVGLTFNTGETTITMSRLEHQGQAQLFFFSPQPESLQRTGELLASQFNPSAADNSSAPHSLLTALASVWTPCDVYNYNRASPVKPCALKSSH